MKKMSFNELELKLNKKYEKENLSLIKYTDNEIVIKCNTCGKNYNYKTTDRILGKQKKIMCKDCILKDKRRELFKQELFNRFSEDKLEIVKYSKNTEEIIIKCKKCGKQYSFKDYWSVFEKTRNKFCLKCFPMKDSLMEMTRQKFLDFINDNNSNWILNQDITNVHYHENISCICKKCGKESKKSISDYLRDRGCIYCCGHNLKDTESFKKELADDYTLLSEYKNAYSKVLLKHCCGFTYSTTPHNYLTGKGCPQCNRKQSKGERAIEKFLKENNINYEKKFPVFLQEHLLRFDFYLQDYDLYIEFQGIQHFEPVKYFGGVEKFNKQQKLDNLKRQNFNVLEISYKDIEKINDILSKTLKFNDYPEKEYITS